MSTTEPHHSGLPDPDPDMPPLERVDDRGEVVENISQVDSLVNLELSQELELPLMPPDGLLYIADLTAPSNYADRFRSVTNDLSLTISGFTERFTDYPHNNDDSDSVGSEETPENSLNYATDEEDAEYSLNYATDEEDAEFLHSANIFVEQTPTLVNCMPVHVKEIYLAAKGKEAVPDSCPICLEPFDFDDIDSIFATLCGHLLHTCCHYSRPMRTQNICVVCRADYKL